MNGLRAIHPTDAGLLTFPTSRAKMKCICSRTLVREEKYWFRTKVAGNRYGVQEEASSSTAMGIK
jgi:hypothetical protein